MLLYRMSCTRVKYFQELQSFVFTTGAFGYINTKLLQHAYLYGYFYKPFMQRQFHFPEHFINTPVAVPVIMPDKRIKYAESKCLFISQLQPFHSPKYVFQEKQYCPCNTHHHFRLQLLINEHLQIHAHCRCRKLLRLCFHFQVRRN